MAGSLRAAALLAPSAVTLGLGVWQLRRRGVKEALLEERAGLLAREPRPLREAVADAAAAGGTVADMCVCVYIYIYIYIHTCVCGRTV